MKDFLLQTFPNPERKGCPDETTIQALAEERLLFDAKTGEHIGSCSECYAEYRHFRRDWEEQGGVPSESISSHFSDAPGPSLVRTHKPWRRFVAIAASLLIVAVGGLVIIQHQHHPQELAALSTTNSLPVEASLDLFEKGTARGAEDDGTSPLSEVSLPPAVVHLTVVLPRYSDAGAYTVTVSKDKGGADVLSSASGTAMAGSDGKVSIAVLLDLRSAERGSYFLDTVRGTDNGTYYYPLKIK